VRNCLIAAGNSGNRALEAPVARLLADPDPVVPRPPEWALARLTAVP
jgi:epoxyqueuosine reductase